MRAARPHELKEEAVPALKIQLPQDELAKLFPIRMKDIDPLIEPEPSKGILIRLNSGDYAVLIYGKLSETLTVLAVQANLPRTVESLLDEVPIPHQKIIWRVPLQSKFQLKKKAAKSRHLKKLKLSPISATQPGRLASHRAKSHRTKKAEPAIR